MAKNWYNVHGTLFCSFGNVGEKSLAEMWDLVKKSFEKCGMTEEDALLNARMARILRFEDYDFKNKEAILWQL